MKLRSSACKHAPEFLVWPFLPACKNGIDPQKTYYILVCLCGAVCIQKDIWLLLYAKAFFSTDLAEPINYFLSSHLVANRVNECITGSKHILLNTIYYLSQFNAFLPF